MDISILRHRVTVSPLEAQVRDFQTQIYTLQEDTDEAEYARRWTNCQIKQEKQHVTIYDTRVNQLVYKEQINRFQEYQNKIDAKALHSREQQDISHKDIQRAQENRNRREQAREVQKTQNTLPSRRESIARIKEQKNEIRVAKLVLYRERARLKYRERQKQKQYNFSQQMKKSQGDINILNGIADAGQSHYSGQREYVLNNEIPPPSEKEENDKLDICVQNWQDNHELGTIRQIMANDTFGAIEDEVDIQQLQQLLHTIDTQEMRILLGFDDEKLLREMLNTSDATAIDLEDVSTIEVCTDGEQDWDTDRPYLVPKESESLMNDYTN